MDSMIDLLSLDAAEPTCVFLTWLLLPASLLTTQQLLSARHTQLTAFSSGFESSAGSGA